MTSEYSVQDYLFNSLKVQVMRCVKTGNEFIMFTLYCCSYLFFPKCIAQRHDSSLIGKNKLIIDTSVYKSWPSVEGGALSNDGRYISYVIKNIPNTSWTAVVKSRDGKWEMRIPGARKILFTDDSKFLVYSVAHDSLYIIKLGKSVVATFSGVNFYQLIGKGVNEEVIMYMQKREAADLFLYNCESRKCSIFSSISRFYVGPDQESLIVLQDSTIKGRKDFSLNWIRGYGDKVVKVWNGTSEVTNLVIGIKGKKAAFLVRDSLMNFERIRCFYFDKKSDKKNLLFSNESEAIGEDDEIVGLVRFSDDERKLLFSTSKKNKSHPKNITSPVKVNVWSYLDKELQSVQVSDSNRKISSTFAFNLNNSLITKLTLDGDIVLDDLRRDKILIWHTDPESDIRESRWNKAARPSYYLRSAEDGEIVRLDSIGRYQCRLSPEEKYVVFFNGTDYFSYDVANKKYINLTSGIKTKWLNYFTKDLDSIPRGIAAWLQNDSGVLIYDMFDIWILDPKGDRMPLNLTNSTGAKKNIIFTLGLPEYLNNRLDWGERLILNATGINTKENGYFVKNIGRSGDPEILTYGAFVYNLLKNSNVSQKGQMPFKARDVNEFLVSRMNASTSLNYFLTSDFKVFSSISNVHPEKRYNWYTAELHTWKTLQGDSIDGILYKPEDFDSTKKYPIIFNYYEKLSFNLNVCLMPDYSSGAINIPSYVSKGYLVFTPDIHYMIGDPMQGTYNSVISAVRYLSQFSYIDSSRMGIQGFSFGGIQTNYLVANTNLFAAACSASGLSNFISAYGAISIKGNSLLGNFEKGGQARMGGAPWNLTEMYIKNSPIFKADKVTTPLLMMHTTGDAICPISQAFEFFIALRRLEKKVWLLEYKDGRHSIAGKSAIDFDLRMAQFFDHYLKDKPAPHWMTKANASKDEGNR